MEHCEDPDTGEELYWTDEAKEVISESMKTGRPATFHVRQDCSVVPAPKEPLTVKEAVNKARERFNKDLDEASEAMKRVIGYESTQGPPFSREDYQKTRPTPGDDGPVFVTELSPGTWPRPTLDERLTVNTDPAKSHGPLRYSRGAENLTYRKPDGPRVHAQKRRAASPLDHLSDFELAELAVELRVERQRRIDKRGSK